MSVDYEFRPDAPASRRFSLSNGVSRAFISECLYQLTVTPSDFAQLQGSFRAAEYRYGLSIYQLPDPVLRRRATETVRDSLRRAINGESQMFHIPSEWRQGFEERLAIVNQELEEESWRIEPSRVEEYDAIDGWMASEIQVFLNWQRDKPRTDSPIRYRFARDVHWRAPHDTVYPFTVLLLYDMIATPSLNRGLISCWIRLGELMTGGSVPEDIQRMLSRRQINRLFYRPMIIDIGSMSDSNSFVSNMLRLCQRLLRDKGAQGWDWKSLGPEASQQIGQAIQEMSALCDHFRSGTLDVFRSRSRRALRWIHRVAHAGEQ